MVVPEGVTKIYGNSFRDCTLLQTMTLPSTVTIVGSYAFYNDTSLVQINIAKTMSQVQSLKYNNWKIPSGVTIHCTDGDITTT